MVNIRAKRTSKCLIRLRERVSLAILKRNCKIGSHSVVMPGVTVGENSVVGACSFVNQDVLDNQVVAGIPIRLIKTMDKL